MSFNDFKLGIVNTPLAISLYSDDRQEGQIAPGIPEFIISENEKDILTEGNQYIVTET
jgi:hypothetical protein